MNMIDRTMKYYLNHAVTNILDARQSDAPTQEHEIIEKHKLLTLNC